MHLLFPLVASLLFVTAVLFLKRAAVLGVGVWRSAFIANMVTATVFSMFWFQEGTLPDLHLLYQPALVAFCFLLGQLLQLLALEYGDVSIATPVQGTKILVVAGLQTWLTNEPVTPALWVASGLAVGSVALFSSSGGGAHRRVGFTILISLCSGAGFALFDVLVQRYTPGWGTSRLLPVMFAFVALYSMVFPFFFKGSLRAIPRVAWPAMTSGACFIAAQALAIICGISLYGHATEMNVVYSARGLWSVLAVWMVGHWFQNDEQHLGVVVLRRRLIGAVLLLSAIVLVLMK